MLKKGHRSPGRHLILILSLENATRKSIIIALATDNQRFRQVRGSTRQVKTKQLYTEQSSIKPTRNIRECVKRCKQTSHRNIIYQGNVPLAIKDRLCEHFIHNPDHNNATTADLMTQTPIAASQSKTDRQ